MSNQLIEILKSSENHIKWEDISQSLRLALKEPGHKINVVIKSLMIINGCLNKNGKQSNLSREKPTEYIKMICKHKNLSYFETMRNGLNCLELSGECFRVVIILQDIRLMQMASKPDLIKQVLIEYNKEKPTNCPELQKSISEGDYSLLLVHIEELIHLYSVGNDKAQQMKAFLCLQSLEEDINKLSQCQIITKPSPEVSPMLPLPTNIIGIIKPRSGGIPSQFIFYLPKSDSKNVSERFNTMVQLMPHNETNMLPFIPLVNLQKDGKGNCVPSFVTADSLKCVSLAAKFVLKLIKPLALSEVNIQKICSITNLSVITAGDRENYIDLICEQAGSPLTCQDSFYSILPNDKELAFRILNEPFTAKSVTYIPFLLPSQLPKIIAIIKKQAAVNEMMESFLLTNAVDDFERDCSSAKPIYITLVSHDELLCSFVAYNNGDSIVKLSISFNDLGQSVVKINSLNKSVNNPEKVVQKYNNLPMVIFWMLYKSGDLMLKEAANFVTNDPNQANILERSQNERDRIFLNECLDSCYTNVTINSSQNKDIYSKIKIEPKLELLTTTYQQVVTNSPALSSYNSDSAAQSNNKMTTPMSHPYEQNILQHQEFQGPYPNQYLHQANNSGVPNQTHNHTNSNSQTNQLNCGPSSLQNQSIKNEQYPLYASQGTKHMSLDQMLSSDFAMPFSSDGIPSFNPLSHSLHYPEHSSNTSMVNNSFGGHMGNIKEPSNSKAARQMDTQSSVLVNLLNSNENSASSNSSLMSRQGPTPVNPPCFPPNTYLNDQHDLSKNSHPLVIRGAHNPRMRMPHPNQQPKPMIGTNYIPSIPSTRPVHNPKTDVMMMPYPQDTGSVRGASVRKPRKRRTPNLELNQRLPKIQNSQFPLIQQPTPVETMYMANMPMNHPPPSSMINQNQSCSVASFSSPTTMDQSVYDFDDNVEFSRIRTLSTSSSISPHASNPNNIAALQRRVSGSGSKKPLKVKISRKIIEENKSLDNSIDPPLPACYDNDIKVKEKAMCRSTTMPNISSILSAPSSTSSTNTMIGITTTASSTNHTRPTAIMSAIDSPLTCSSISSLQASPYGSVHIASQHNLPGAVDSNNVVEIKKRRKRRPKLDPSDDADILLKREKIEIRKQNKKKKELGSISGMSSHGSMENLTNLINDSNLKPPPLPIKLSVNAKMGSVSNTSVTNLSNKSKMLASNSNTALSQGNGPCANPNPALLKQSLKDLNREVEPILKNYKIPKKKANDNQDVSMQLTGSLLATHSEHVSKSSKDFSDLNKSDNCYTDRNKSPMSSHHDGSVMSNTSTQSTSIYCDSNVKQGMDNQSTSSGQKGKNLNDVVNRLIAKTSTGTPINPESINSNPTSPNDMSRMKPSEYSQSSSENIFEKFSNSKSIPKAELRNFPLNRFQDPSMNVPRYSYNRPVVYPPRVPLPPTNFNYGIRQPYIGNPNMYRMESPTPRNFTPIPNNPQFHKKNNNNVPFPRKKS